MSQLRAAISEARTCLTSGLDHHVLSHNKTHEIARGETQIRRRYFGELGRRDGLSLEDNRYVNDVFRQMQDQWNKTTWACAKACTPGGVLAYARRDKNEVTFCPNVLQRDDLSSILIHEMTHTAAVGGSRHIPDIRPTSLWQCTHVRKIWGVEHGAYGSHNAQQLASWSSAAAVLNADNYLHYAVETCQLRTKRLIPTPAVIDHRPLPAECFEAASFTEVCSFFCIFSSLVLSWLLYMHRSGQIIKELEGLIAKQKM